MSVFRLAGGNGLRRTLGRVIALLALCVIGGLQTAASLAQGWAPGDRFRDCDRCPEMVVVPAARFVMGSAQGEAGRDGDEGPQHWVQIAQPFAVGVFEVTFAEWDACGQDFGCDGFGGDQGWGRGERPVVGVSWSDAQAYVRWLSQRTGAGYRLLSESEWEYVARAGTTTSYHFGRTVSAQEANCCGKYARTLPGGAFAPNAFGLHDVHGNAWEWVQDCYHSNYEGAPGHGGAWTKEDCPVRVVRGGSWKSEPRLLRVAIRNWYGPDVRNNEVGFRVARTLP